METKLMRKQREWPLRPEQLQWARSKIGRWSTLQLDLGRLNDGEQRALLDLVKAASAGADVGIDKFDPDQLGKRDRKKFEALVERAAGVEAGAIQKARETASFHAEVERLAKEALRSTPTKVEEGKFFREVREQLSHEEGTCLDSEHLGVLTGVLAVYFSARPPVGSALTVDQDADGKLLRWRKGYHLLGVADGEEISGRTETLLKHLAANAWFDVVDGAEMEIRLGSRARGVFGEGKGKRS